MLLGGSLQQAQDRVLAEGERMLAEALALQRFEVEARSGQGREELEQAVIAIGRRRGLPSWIRSRAGFHGSSLPGS
ncbi:MAG: hypothetical protein CL908_13550 [Deltaproteobacteria bacterium]|nr:hypothetical protein [Deltaproteobacteria bacterium]